MNRGMLTGPSPPEWINVMMRIKPTPISTSTPMRIATVLSASALLLLAVATTTARAESHLVDFSLPDADGRVHRLSDHRGKWVVINFWATWCGPCMVEIPELMRFHERHKVHDAIVIGVNFAEIDTPDLVKFIAEMDINYLVVRAGDKPILPFEPLKGLPSTFFVDPRGELVASHVGPVTGEAIDDFLAREALREGQGAAPAAATQ